MYKNTDLAEVAAAKIFSLETRTAGNYMLLSNLYSACGSWQNSAKVRMLAKTKGLKKNPGQSWIEVQNKVHTFLAGNALHPGLKEVYHILEDLGLKMETDYVTTRNSSCGKVSYDEDRLRGAISHGEVLVDHLRRRRMGATTLSAQLSLLQIVGAENPVLISAAEQIFGAGGKKLRPALVFLVSRATADLANLKELTPKHRRLAEVIEMIHTASLIHDDVLDDSSIRRGHQPTIATLGAEQFSEADPIENQSKAMFFSYFYFALNAGSLLSNTVLVYFEDSGHWTAGFWASAGAALLGFLLFLIGTKWYRHYKPCGNPLTRVAQVFVAAGKKRKVSVPTDADELYELEGSESAINGSRKIYHK
ncbi:hypothetical protein Sjap_011678 [Stephania japonica]|uniref:Uncharacterized protein n=1 Tax=Stephania japonica TaxID=461633 RepID=A0AAP0JDL3_9MAGN